ncbi:tRNA (guanosine(37)-N1)-methyltransferase TrmD [Paraphotobacterium marinum]|uniref:tRNA (guanosine(37)-N1)-methyltransferase TrmD n=1 Tax=Paraphotobacterium marinum TaxID=1755811 RepID=UPI0026C27D90
MTNEPLNIGVITIFPEMFESILKSGIVAKAINNNLVSITFSNPRDFAEDNRKTIDEKVFGGGPGMLMMAPPLEKSLKFLKKKLGDDSLVVYVSPQGKKFNNVLSKKVVNNNKIILICGRYEGIDERFIETFVDEEWSIGDYVLTGGELASMVIIDSVTRFIPGALGDKCSVEEDSFENGLLDYPHYTKPRVYNGKAVPDILLNGNHEKILDWRQKQSLGRTWLRRPELLENLALTDKQEKLLSEFIEERKNLMNE